MGSVKCALPCLRLDINLAQLSFVTSFTFSDKVGTHHCCVDGGFYSSAQASLKLATNSEAGHVYNSAMETSQKSRIYSCLCLSLKTQNFSRLLVELIHYENKKSEIVLSLSHIQVVDFASLMALVKKELLVNAQFEFKYIYLYYFTYHV